MENKTYSLEEYKGMVTKEHYDEAFKTLNESYTRFDDITTELDINSRTLKIYLDGEWLSTCKLDADGFIIFNCKDYSTYKSFKDWAYMEFASMNDNNILQRVANGKQQLENKQVAIMYRWLPKLLVKSI